jgi:hypothetical protein
VPDQDTPETSGARPDRKDTRLLGAHVKEALHRKVKVVTARNGISISAFIHRAIALGLKELGESPDSSSAD